MTAEALAIPAVHNAGVVISQVFVTAVRLMVGINVGLGGATPLGWQFGTFVGGSWHYVTTSGANEADPCALTHVAVTHAPGNPVRLYLNGSLAASTSTSPAGSSGGGNWQCGRSHAGVAPYSGGVGAVAIYRSALSADRILAHVQAAGLA